jgi:hypothetical protein
MFIQIHCEKKHLIEEKKHWEPLMSLSNYGLIVKPTLCMDCLKLLDYSANRRRLCPLDPKPTCRKCTIHCYQEDYRNKIRDVMRFSGRHFLFYSLRNGLLRESLKILTHFIQ